MSRFQVKEIAKRKQERQQERETAIKRAKEFIAKNPDASRKRVADYAGVSVTTLDKISETSDFTMPKALTPQQTRKASNWGTILGGLSKK
jgi:ABC-type nitrate/sulfonate/bicarbonate transport system substrate-binding protein